MKVSIISDIEGTSGAVWGGYGLPPSGELRYETELMTAEVNIVVRTLQQLGVRDIYLYEAHKMQAGILPPDIQIGRTMPLLKGSQALFFIGQHGPAGVRRAVRAHTMSGVTTYQMRLNGMICGELTMCAAYAGVLGIPTVLVSGERQTLLESRRNLPRPCETVCDEIGYSNHTALCRPWRSIEKELRVKTERALKLVGRTPPCDFGRIYLKIKKRYQGMGEKIARYSFIRREGDWIVFEAPDMVRAFELYLTVEAGRGFWNFKVTKH